jgi:hypothetical protein
MEHSLIDPLTLAIGVAICWAGAVAWWLTLSMTGIVLGAGGGLALGVVLIRGLEPSPAIGWGLLALLALVGGWIGLRAARRVTAVMIGMLAAVVGGGAAHILLRAYMPAIEPGTTDYMIAVAVTTVAAGAIGTIFRRQFVMLVAAVIGGLIIVTSFDPHLGPEWLGGIAVISLLLQSLTIGFVRGRRRRGSDED